MRYVIRDWAGNILYDGMTFDDPRDAWTYLQENILEDTLDSYQVEID